MFRMKDALFLVCICFVSTTTFAQETPASPEDLQLSQELRALLQAEMRELAGASQAVTSAFVMGDWQSIQRISEQIRASYIMERNISDTQKQELRDKLPAHFKRLDADFHARAERLGSAAAAEDPEIVAFHYYRMLETCATCHAEFAKSRFPGFSSAAPGDHHH